MMTISIPRPFVFSVNWNSKWEGGGGGGGGEIWGRWTHFFTKEGGVESYCHNDTDYCQIYDLSFFKGILNLVAL